jgi:hypothetical protein
MPRGGTDAAKGQLTDAEGIAAFQSSIESQYGPYPNAEALIVAHQGSQDPALRRAMLTQVDPDATDDFEHEDAEASFELDEGEKLLSYAVRGNALVGVVENENGDWRKAVTGANDQYEAPKLTAGEQAAKAQAEAQAELQREAARLRDEMELKVAELRVELQEEQAAAMEAFAAEQQQAVEAAAEEAEAPKAEAKSTAKAKS